MLCKREIMAASKALSISAPSKALGISAPSEALGVSDGNPGCFAKSHAELAPRSSEKLFPVLTAIWRFSVKPKG